MKSPLLRAIPAFFAIVVSVVSIPTIANAQADGPNVSFDYSPIFDFPCYAALNQAPDTATIVAARSRLPVWRADWNHDSPALFKAAVQLTNAQYRFKESKAALITCQSYPSMSLPLMINVRRLVRMLASDAPAGTGAPDSREFTLLLFHEILHRFVDDQIATLPGHTTPLLQKYATEAPVVRSHLHVLALIDAVYGKLGIPQSATPVGNTVVAGVRGANDMNRAREIIKAEGVQAIVQELGTLR
jgi:hypothetical protein